MGNYQYEEQIKNIIEDRLFNCIVQMCSEIKQVFPKNSLSEEEMGHYNWKVYQNIRLFFEQTDTDIDWTDQINNSITEKENEN